MPARQGASGCCFVSSFGDAGALVHPSKTFPVRLAGHEGEQANLLIREHGPRLRRRRHCRRIVTQPCARGGSSLGRKRPQLRLSGLAARGASKADRQPLQQQVGAGQLHHATANMPQIAENLSNPHSRWKCALSRFHILPPRVCSRRYQSRMDRQGGRAVVWASDSDPYSGGNSAASHRNL